MLGRIEPSATPGVTTSMGPTCGRKRRDELTQFSALPDGRLKSFPRFPLLCPILIDVIDRLEYRPGVLFVVHDQHLQPFEQRLLDVADHVGRDRMVVRDVLAGLHDGRQVDLEDGATARAWTARNDAAAV